MKKNVPFWMHAVHNLLVFRPRRPFKTTGSFFSLRTQIGGVALNALIGTIGVITFFFVAMWTTATRSAAETADPKAGKQAYDTLCVSCHGSTGKGDGPAAVALPVKPQNHTNGEYMNALTDEYLFNIVKSGGVALGKSPLMPPWGGQLKDQDIHNVVVYIRSLAVPAYEAPK